MKSPVIHHKAKPDPIGSRDIAEWMAEAGITVEEIETRPTHTCPVCRPAELHVAA